MGYEYLQLTPHRDFIPFFNHPRADDDLVAQVPQGLRDAGVGIASVLPVLRWSGPDEDAREAAVRNWKRVIQLLHRPKERAFGLLGPFGAPGELGVDDVDAQVDSDLDNALPVAHRGLAGVLVGSRPAQHRQHRGYPDSGVGAGLAELGHQVVVGTRVVEERDEVSVRGELQVLVAQIGDHVREFEQLIVMVERSGVECDLHAQAPLIDSRGDHLDLDGCPVSSDCTPAAHTAAAA